MLTKFKTFCTLQFLSSLAGSKSLHWVCAGDTAQMILRGCSFRFEGLKQTMLAIRPGIEVHLRQGEKRLLKNYRMTKGILEVGNAILRVIQNNFPGAITPSAPETAMRDLGLTVNLCDWDQALLMKATFLPHQALIYPSSGS